MLDIRDQRELVKYCGQKDKNKLIIRIKCAMGWYSGEKGKEGGSKAGIKKRWKGLRARGD